MSKIIGAHGIWSTGDQSVDKAGRRMSERYGMAYCDVRLPHTRLVDQRIERKLRENAEAVLSVAEPGDHLIAHSTGVSISNKAGEMIAAPGGSFGVGMMVAGALNAGAEWPGGFRKIVCVHNHFDQALFWGSFLWDHRFGTYGKTGFARPSAVHENWPIHKRGPDSWHHNGAFNGNAFNSLIEKSLGKSEKLC